MATKLFSVLHLLFQSDYFHLIRMAATMSVPLYYEHADGFLLVYSVTDSSSLEYVKEIYQHMLGCTV